MKFISKLYKTLSLIKHWKKYTNCDSYYPNEEHKSKASVFWDQLFFVWKYGEVEPFYFAYGFDKESMTRQRMINEYILPYSFFQKRINYLNFHHPRYGICHGRAITSDKFYFYIFLSKVGIPTPRVYCYIKNKELIFCDSEFTIDPSLSVKEQLHSLLSYEMDAFVKPSDGALGNGVFSLRVSGNRFFIDEIETSEIVVIEKLLSANYLIQERIKQHPKMAALCPSSINTIRLQTVIDDDDHIHPFGAGLRIGRIWNRVDNWAKGGVFVGINMREGTLKPLGVIKPQYGASTFSHPDTGVKFDGFVIPFYKEAESLAIKLHHFLYRCHSVGWDIAITEQGPVFIEGNGWWEISLIQAAHGGLKDEIEHYYM